MEALYKNIIEKNLKISYLVEEDIDDIVEMLKNESVCEYLYFAPAPEEVYRGYFEPIAREIKERIEKGRNPKNVVFIFRDLKTNEFIGQSGMTMIPMIDGVYEVGYQFREEFWGSGLATISCELVLDYAFNTVNAYRVEANCYENNLGSKRVLEKCGLELEGISKNYYKVEDKYVSRLNFGITKIS